MSQPFWTHTVQIAVMLVASGALGLWLGYLLWHKWRRLHDQVRGELDAALSRNQVLLNDLSSLNVRLSDCESARKAVRVTPVAPVTPDDLKVVEGIGPKIEKLCNAIGIYTWRQLAQTSVEQLQAMLVEAGPDYKVAVPTTWPRQAELAAAGKWKELKEYQDVLQGGRAP